MKAKYDAAKALGAVVNEAKGKVSELKALIEQRRVQRSVLGGDMEAEDPEEERAKVAMEKVGSHRTCDLGLMGIDEGS